MSKKKRSARPATRRKNSTRRLKESPATKEESKSSLTDVRLLTRLAADRNQSQDRTAVEQALAYAKYLRQVEVPTEPAGSKSRAAVSRKNRRPLRILAEGDSWFNYPIGPLPHPFEDGVVFQLERLLGYQILNMAKPGDEVRQMLGLAQRRALISRLSNPYVHYDALLFSGGGNDLVGDQFCMWLKDTPPEPLPENMLDLASIDGELAVLEQAYRDVAGIRDAHSRDTVIFVNCYDFPDVTGIGVCGLGPWLKPSLDFAYGQIGVPPDRGKYFRVAKTLLQRFRAMLDGIVASGVRDFIVVDTQGTLRPTPADWQNEIHPSSSGFRQIAKKFFGALKTRFP